MVLLGEVRQPVPPSGQVGGEFGELRPASAQQDQNHSQRQDGPRHVNHELYAVVPYDRPHSAGESVEDGGQTDHHDADADVQTHDLLQDNRGQIQAQAVGQVARDQEQQGGGLLGGPAEPAMEDLVGREHPAAKIRRQEQPDHHQPTDDVADG